MLKFICLLRKVVSSFKSKVLPFLVSYIAVKAAFGDGFLYVYAPSYLLILTNRCSLTAAFSFPKGKRTIAREEKLWIAAKIQKTHVLHSWREVRKKLPQQAWRHYV